jgi:hypothetical protein
MLGGYVAYSAYAETDSYALAVLAGAVAMALDRVDSSLATYSGDL